MRKPTELSAAERAAAWCDAAVLVLLAMLLAFMPFAFGAVHAWSELVVTSLAAAIAVCLAARQWLGAGTARSWVWVPLGAFVVLVWIQVVPLPADILRGISPNTLALKSLLLHDLPAGADPGNMTVSFYPNGTIHDLRLALVAVTVFAAVVSVIRKPGQVKRLLGTVAVIGGAAGLLALVQDAFGNGAIYWAVPTPGGRAHGGPFVNPGHFAQFMNLSMGAALALIIVKLHEAFEGRKLTVAAAAEVLTARGMRVVWLMCGVVLVGLAAVFMSFSHAGMVAALMSGGLLTAALAARRRVEHRSWVLVLIAAGAIVCVLYLGFDAAHGRLAAMAGSVPGRSQAEMLRDIATPVSRFPSLGVGLGAHAVVYPMFDQGTCAVQARYAGNDYVQLLEETGIVGLELMAAFLVCVWLHGYRSMRTLRAPVESAVFGLGFGLAAAMIQGAAGFGLHVPANACLAAVTCGLMVGLSQREEERIRKERGRWVRRLAAAVGVGAVAAWAVGSAWTSAAAESHWAAARTLEAHLRSADWRGSDAEYERLLGHAAAARANQPHDVSYAYWLDVYRWRAISRNRSTEGGNVLLGREARIMVNEIVADLHSVRRDCPTFGPVYSLAGQLERFVLDDPGGAAHIRAGYWLARNDPSACFAAGMLDVRDGRPDNSLPKFRRCVLLDSTMLAEIINVYIRQAKRPDLAIEIARSTFPECVRSK